MVAEIPAHAGEFLGGFLPTAGPAQGLGAGKADMAQQRRLFRHLDGAENFNGRFFQSQGFFIAALRSEDAGKVEHKLGRSVIVFTRLLQHADQGFAGRHFGLQKLALFHQVLGQFALPHQRLMRRCIGRNGHQFPVMSDERLDMLFGLFVVSLGLEEINLHHRPFPQQQGLVISFAGQEAGIGQQTGGVDFTLALDLLCHLKITEFEIGRKQFRLGQKFSNFTITGYIQHLAENFDGAPVIPHTHFNASRSPVNTDGAWSGSS